MTQWQTVALGVLLFLIWDILSKALEPIEAAMKDGMNGTDLILSARGV